MQGAEHMTDQRGGEHERAAGRSEAISYPIRKASNKMTMGIDYKALSYLLRVMNSMTAALLPPSKFPTKHFSCPP